jgi:hypothetical protein
MIIYAPPYQFTDLRNPFFMPGRDDASPYIQVEGEGGITFDDDTLLDAVLILFPSIFTASCISFTTLLCWIKRSPIC